MLLANKWICFGAVAAVAGLVLAGCSGRPAVNPPAESDQSPAQASNGGSSAKALAKLTAADREAAVKQAVCPVTGEALGSMGTPPKVAVNGQEVFLCCAGCEEELRKDSEKYLAKMKSK